MSQISTSASAAVGVSYSLMSMIQALGFTLGMGSGNYLSRVLGSRDTRKSGADRLHGVLLRNFLWDFCLR